MSVLALVRHGRTAWNLERRLQGHADNPLVAEGIADARGSAELLRSGRWSGIIATPLRRTQQSAAVIAELLGLPDAEIDPALIERDYGSSDGLPVALAQRRWPGTHAAPDAESLSALAERGARDFDRLLSERPGHIVVAHGALIRAGAARLTGLDLPRIGNGSVVLLRRDGAGVSAQIHEIAATAERW